MPSSLSERYLSPLAAELGRVFGVLGFKDLLHAAPLFATSHHDEIPRLRKANAGRMMGPDKHACEHFVGNRIRNEFADIAAAEDGLVEAALEGVGESEAIGCIDRHVERYHAQVQR